jgi:hypothetical protein
LIDSTMSDTLITQDQSSFIDSNAWCNHCLVSEIYLEEKDAITHDLDSLSLELRSNHEYKISIQKMNNDEECFTLDEKYKELLCKQEDELGSSSEEIRKVEKSQEVFTSNQIESYHQQLVHIENIHNSELLKLFEQHSADKVDWVRRIKGTTKAKIDIRQIHEDKLGKKTQSLLNKLNHREHLTHTLKDELLNLRLELTERKSQIEDDIDTHLQAHKLNKEQMLLAERQATLKVAGENGILSKRTTALIQSIEDQKDAIKHLLYREESDNEEIKMLQTSTSHLDISKRQRDKIFYSKEKTSSRLKTRQEELTKFNVLDEKIKELNICVSKDEVIPSTKKKLNKKEDLLASFHSEHLDIEKLVSFRQYEINTKKRDLSKQRGKYVGIASQLESLKKELCSCINLMNEPEKLLQVLSERTKNISKFSYADEAANVDDNMNKEDMVEFEMKLKLLTSSLDGQRQQELQDLEDLRGQNQLLLETIRERTDENSRSKNRMKKIV